MKTSSQLDDPRTLVLFGLPFHDVTMAETLDWVDHLIHSKSSAYLVTANLDFAAQASQDVELQRILLEAELVLCDGTPLVWASRMTGRPLRERVAGSDLVPRLVTHAEKRGYRIFLLGGQPEILETAANRLMADHPLLPKVEFFSPPFAQLLEMSHEEIIRQIQQYRPHILLVAFGCPKQEKWIYMHYRDLGIPCCIGVGATIDFLAGRVSRAPQWVARCGLEWVYRLAQEPRRLGGRYLRDFVFLLIQTWKEARTIHRAAPLSARTEAAAENPRPRDNEKERFQLLSWSGALVAGRLDCFERPEMTRPVIIDLSRVTSVDSSGLGLLLRVIRQAWNTRLAICLLAPSPAVKMVVAVTKLERVLPLVETMPEARDLLEKEQLARQIRPDRTLSPDLLRFHLPARLTAENAGQLGEVIRSAWEDSPATKSIVLDLSATTFMDSSGLGLLVSIHRLVGRRDQSKLALENVHPNVENVIRIARLQEVLMP